MYSIVNRNKNKNNSKSITNNRENIIPKAHSIQDYCNWKYNKKQSFTKIKVIINNNERELKFTYLAKPDNVANILTVRKDVFALVDTYNFIHDEALSLLTPSYFKERIQNIYNRQTTNLYRWNKTWDELI